MLLPVGRHSPEGLFSGREQFRPLPRRIEIEAGIDAEGGAIVEKAPAGTFGFRQNLVGLLQR